VNQLELIVDIESPIGTLHLSDRNKYVGGTFYEARLNFPTISRTVGEYLSPTLEFSQLQLEINNADGAFNNILPAGDDYSAWVGKSISVKLGLRDVSSTYKEIFNGKVTDQGGFQRTVKSFTLIARNSFEAYNVSFPKNLFTLSDYPNIDVDLENTLKPIIYGDWTVNVETGGASVPALVVNGVDPDVDGSSSFTKKIQCVISDNVNTYFDTTKVYLKKQDSFYLMDSSDIVNVNADKNYFEIRQKDTVPAGVTLVEGVAYQYASGDKFFVMVKGKDLGAYDDNILWQARDILITYGGVPSGDFDSSWDTYRDKASPAESATGVIKSRIWIQEQQETLNYSLQLLEQVRLELFVDRNQKFKINSLHLDDFDPNPSHKVRNWDVERDSFSPKLDDRNSFNRAKASYNHLPSKNEDYQETGIYKNTLAISQVGKEISKKIVFPNLYEATAVENQLKEILKISSAYFETVEMTLTWRSLLLDIGDFVKINVSIQSTQFSDVPAMIRDIGYDPNGVKLPVKLWSMQLLPFPGYSPGYAGTTGGTSSTIVLET
jgi:hypothetical protein